MVTRLTHVLGAKHLGVAEDAVQDALLRALQAWPVGGVPAQPAAWLFTVARHRALDRLRRDTWFRDREGIITAAVLALGEQGLRRGTTAVRRRRPVRDVPDVSPGAVAGRARGPDAQDGVRLRRRRDRARLPAAGDDGGAATRPGEADVA